MLEVYDTIIGEYLALPDTEVMVVTGVAQKPYDRIKYYWRLKKHADYLKAVAAQEKLSQMVV